MCRVKAPAIATPKIEPAISKTDAAIQNSAQSDLERQNLSTKGFAASLLTGGLGLTTPAPTKGITLGGR